MSVATDLETDYCTAPFEFQIKLTFLSAYFVHIISE